MKILEIFSPEEINAIHCINEKNAYLIISRYWNILLFQGKYHLKYIKHLIIDYIYKSFLDELILSAII